MIGSVNGRLGYRIAWQYDLDADGTVETTGSNHDPWLYQVHDTSWRVVATVFAVDDGAGTEAGEYLAKADDDPRELFVFHTAGLNGRGTSSKLDDVILRDRDANATWGQAGDGTAEERTYYAQNWRGDVVALLDNTGGRKETIRYSAYGTPFGMPAGDVDGLGQVNAGDFFLLAGASGESYGDPGYNVRVDINLDGTVDATDSTIQSGQSGYSLGRGNLSRSPSLSGGVGNRLGYAGYAWEPSSSKYHVRHRVLDPLRGRWSRRDPLGYVDAPTLFAYVGNRAMTAVDPRGTRPQELARVCPKASPAPLDEPSALMAPIFPGDRLPPECIDPTDGGKWFVPPPPPKCDSNGDPCKHWYDFNPRLVVQGDIDFGNCTGECLLDCVKALMNLSPPIFDPAGYTDCPGPCNCVTAPGPMPEEDTTYPTTHVYNCGGCTCTRTAVWLVGRTTYYGTCEDNFA